MLMIQHFLSPYIQEKCFTNVVRFKTRISWVVAVVYIISFLLVAFLLIAAYEKWETAKTKSLGLITLAGIICQIAGFIILLNPIIIKIVTKRESNLTYDGIFYVIAGLILQGVSVYLSL